MTRRNSTRRARVLVQLGFLTLTLVGVYIVRGNAERWCPFGGVEALYTYVAEGSMPCSLSISNFYILGAVLVAALLLRRAFCSHVCPIGTLSEWLGRGAAWAGLGTRRVPPRLDRGLALLKYAILAVILILTYRAGELIFRGFDPCYALLSRHGEDITLWAYVSAGGIVAASLFLTLPFCRWLCPLAAVLHPFTRFGLMRVRREEHSCIDCGRCSHACPMAIAVHQMPAVTASRCTSCLECVAACPVKQQKAIRWGMPGAHWRRLPQTVLIAILLTSLTSGVVAAYLFPAASFTRTWGEEPAASATAELRVDDLTCRGRANLLALFLKRDDEFSVGCFLRIEAWPDPESGRVRITYDPAATDEATIKRAIIEPHFDLQENRWRLSPFAIEGYDPFAELEGSD